MLTSLLKNVLSRIAPQTTAGDARRLHAAGEVEAAEAAYRRVLARERTNTDALHGLGVLLGAAGRHAEAIPLLERAALALPAACADLANAYWLAGRAADAERAYLAAVKAGVATAGVYANLGLFYWNASRRREALDAFRRAYRSEPDRPGLLGDLAQLLLECGGADELLALCRNAAACGRDDAELAAAFGCALRELHQPAEALAHFERAARERPHDPLLLTESAMALQDLGRLDEAAGYFDRAILAEPGGALARWHRGVLRLLAGDFARGWDDYDLRLASEDRPRRASGVPPWRGEAVTGRCVLVYGEQGLGDEIMFASCLPDLIAEAGRVALEVSPRLKGLMAASFPGATVISADDAAQTADASAPAFEMAMGSLPGRYRRSVAAFPAHRGYLRADPAAVVAWHDRLGAFGHGLKIGVSWRGGTARSRQALRSLALADLLPVLATRGVTWVNLQYGEVTGEIEAFERTHGLSIAHWPSAIEDLGEMAALVCALDLVVSVCNTTVHLAGALGKHTWALAPRVPEWRYGIAGERMPWYPAVRLFRQREHGAWAPVIEEVSRALMQQR